MKENKCPYCNKTLTYDKDYCDEQCKDNYAKFVNYTQKWSKIFIGATILVCISTFLCAVISIPNKALGEFILSLIFAFLGLLMIVFPFATPETFKWFGVQKTMLIVRILGVILILFAKIA